MKTLTALLAAALFLATAAAPQTRTLKGHVRAWTGAPIEGARLSVYREGKLEAEAVALKDGAFTVEVRPGRHLRVQPSAAGNVFKAVTPKDDGTAECQGTKP